MSKKIDRKTYADMYGVTTGDKVRLGDWFIRLQRWEETIDLLQPLAENLDSVLKAGELTGIVESETASTLRRCGELLLPAYEEVEDDVGYVVANAWQQVYPAGGFPDNWQQERGERPDGPFAGPVVVAALRGRR